MVVSNLFLNQKQSIKLSELGFELPCLAKWSTDGDLILLDKPAINIKTFPVCAPLWQQAFDWFSDNHKIDILIHKYKEDKYFISVNNNYIVDEIDFKLVFTKSEVKSAAIEIAIKHIKK